MISQLLRVSVILVAYLATALVPAWAARSELIAIDVLIQPDQKMMSEAAGWNSLMREQTPEGFELDEEHAPHITLVQLFIAKTDLSWVLAEVEAVKSQFDLDNLEMTATGLYHIPSGKIGLAGIVIEPFRQLNALQAHAVGPRTAGSASSTRPLMRGPTCSFEAD